MAINLGWLTSAVCCSFIVLVTPICSNMHTIPVVFISRSNLSLYDTFEVVGMEAKVKIERVIVSVQCICARILDMCVCVCVHVCMCVCMHACVCVNQNFRYNVFTCTYVQFTICCTISIR